MDYIGRTMNICLILFMIFITGNHCQYFSNRDIILTPHHLKTYPGKVLYYRPREQVPSDEKPNTTGDSGSAVPWEEVLKETVFLALNDNKTSLQQQSSGSTEHAPLLANRLQKVIYNAPYIGVIDLSVPRFGDIVELAHGRLEQDGDESYFLVQQQDGQLEESRRNVTALWKVERIRHRDDLRGHRYELKFTIAASKVPANGEPNSPALEGEQEARDAQTNNRTYIIRDEDYPKYFAPLTISPNAIPMHRKNDQMFDRTFFDAVQSQGHHAQTHQFGSYAPGTRYYRPAVVPQPQQTITLGQYLMQSLLSGGETPKYHHHHHHYAPGKSPAYYGGLAAASSNRIKFPDSFPGSSHSVPKFYQHIHFQRPSIAPLAPTALPGSYLFHHTKDSHAPAPSNIHQDYTKLVDLRGATTPTAQNPAAEATKTTKANNVVAQKPSPATLNHIQQQSVQSLKTSPKPQQFPTQQQQQQFHQQVATIATGVGQQQTAGSPVPNALPQQYSPQQQHQQQLAQQQQQPHIIYRQQVPPQQQQPQQPILIHPHPAHPQVAAGGPPGFFPPSHLIQSIPFYNPQGQMVVNHIPVMSNHHMFQMSPPQPIAIPVHVQLIPPMAPQGHLYGPQQPQPQPHQQDGVQAIPVRIMQPLPNPVHLYSPVNPFLPPLQPQQQPFHHHHHHNQHHPIVTVTPKTTSSTTTNYQHHQHHPHPAHGHHGAANHSLVTPPAGQQTLASPPSPNPHHHSHHSHTTHSFNAIPTVFKFTSSNAIPHPQKTTVGGVGGPTSASSPTAAAQHHRYNTPHVQLSGPSISPTPAHRHRFSTAGAAGKASPSPAASSLASSPSPTSATRPSARYTAAVGQVSGPTVSSTVANHRYAALPTVPASPAGLREKFTAPAFQPAASESKQTPRKLESPTPKANAGVADAVGSPSNAVSPKYESFGVENAVTPSTPAESLLSPSSTVASSLSQHSPHSPTASPASRTTLAGGAFSYSNFVDVSGAVSVTAKLTSDQTSSSASPHHRVSSSTVPLSSVSASAGSPSSTTPVSVTTQATYVPPPKSYIQQLGPTIGVKFPPAFKSMPSVTILPPQIETPISSTLKTYQYLNHHDSYDFIPSRVVELAHVKKMNGQKHAKRNKGQKGQKLAQKPNGPMAVPAGAGMGSAGNHHHHVTVTSNKPLRFYPGEGPEYATHRPEAQLSVQLPPPEKDYTMTYYGTPKHNQKVQRPKNFVTPLHSYQGSSTTPIPPVAVTASSSSPPAVASSVASSPAPASASTTNAPTSQAVAQATQVRNVTVSTFRSATASSTAHYYKNRNEKSDDLTTMAITTMRPRMMLKTIYRQFPGSFVSTSTSTEKPVQKWVPKRPRTSSKATSGEFSTSTLSSSSLPVSGEQAVASSERAIDVVTKTPVVVPVVTAVRPNLDQQMQRVRASRGRSRYTYRRIPSGNPPPIPTGQQQQASNSMRTSRMRNSNFSTSTTTIKPIPGVTSSVFDSNRIDGRSYEQQERKAEEAVMTSTAKNGSNEKIKRDTSEAVEETDNTDREVAVAEQLVAKQAENKQDALEVTEPEKEFVMVKANISPPIATNQSNMVFFEASDAGTPDTSANSSPAESGRSIGSTFDDLTMSIINHAKAIVNQTVKPTDAAREQEEEEEAARATDGTIAPVTGSKSIESNEIAHKDVFEPETTVEVTTTTVAATSSPVTESTVSETLGTTTVEDGADDGDEEASQTTVAVDVA